VIAVFCSMIPKSQIWSAIDGCVDDCRTSQPHYRVGIWLVFIDALMVMLWL